MSRAQFCLIVLPSFLIVAVYLGLHYCVPADLGGAAGWLPAL